MRLVILLLICLVLLNLPWRVEPEALLCFRGLGLLFRLTINCQLPLHEGHLYDALHFGSTPVTSWSTCHCRTSSWALRKENISSKCCWVCASLHRGHGYAEAEHVRFRKMTQYFLASSELQFTCWPLSPGAPFPPVTFLATLPHLRQMQCTKLTELSRRI